MSVISLIRGREVLDSRGNPAVEAEVITTEGIFRAIVPSGSSTGKYEAVELRDRIANRYGGKGVLKAVKNINEIIAPRLKGIDPTQQEEIDNQLIKIDGTTNKKKLGANALLAVSLAVCRAGASTKKVPLYLHIAQLSGTKQVTLPIPFFNIINGGKHAGNALAFQEFMIVPVGAPNFKEAVRYGAEVYYQLKKSIQEKYGTNAVQVGDEGGFAPPIKESEEALELLQRAILKAGYQKNMRISIDVAASELYKKGKYNMHSKSGSQELKTVQEMMKKYSQYIKKYNLFSIEDPFDQDAWQSFIKITTQLGSKTKIVGDDILVTNILRIKKAIQQNACNAIILKVNQIGTLTESIQAAKIAKEANWDIIVSHRSGDTEDSFIADLAVGLGAGYIKAGAPCRSERTSKYNQLLRIEEELGEKAIFGAMHLRK
ncbi:MAG: phosphopyruvate hydratase [Nanoarchaeota archaeon]